MAYLTDQMAYGAISGGRKTVTTAGTRVQLSSTSTPCKRVDIKAMTSNTDVIAVAGSSVVAAAGSETGIVLYPGDGVTLLIDNLNKVYIDSRVNGEGVTYIYYA